MIVICVAAVAMAFAVSPALAVAPPTIGEEFTTEVASSSATLYAKIDPGELPTSYVFEYASSGGSFVPVAEAQGGGVLPAGSTAVLVSVNVQHGLLAHTSYEFRVVAGNSIETVPGAPISFATQTSGEELELLDGRQWELVSPSNKHGANLEPQQHEGGAIEAADDGHAISYIASAPVTSDPQGNRAPEAIQIFSQRTPEGWETQDIGAPQSGAKELSIGAGPEYRMFSSDLSYAVVQPHGEAPLSPEASERTPYIREDGTARYVPLVTPANVPPGTTFGGNPSAEFGDVTVAGATPDLSHIVLKSLVALTSVSAPAGGLYEWVESGLRLISALPEGTIAKAPHLGFQGVDVRHAISDDGTRIVWEENDERHLEWTSMVSSKAETVQLDAVQGGSGEGRTEPIFQTASSNGSKVFFTDSQRLTADASNTATEEPDLYECEMVEGAEGKPRCDLSDLSVPGRVGETADVRGVVLGASEDGSYVYFVASGVLAPGGQSGGYNLYVRHGGVMKLVAILSGNDMNWETLRAYGELSELTASVSADGRYLAFMSEQNLTGYDNRDAGSGEPDEEVYLYDAEAEAGRGKLVCASCDPTGARPIGVFDSGVYPGLLIDEPKIWKGRWLAASVPGWTRESLATALYQPRYLSDSGRLFFDSPDSLVPQATNGVEDVYEYEPGGVGDCTRASTQFSERSGGCVGLVSAGSSGEESAFLDASENGEDAFFLTAEPLVAADKDTAYDVYDAHVCSALVPCGEPVVAPPACTTVDSCRPAPASQPAIFGPPASATFSGTGNPSDAGAVVQRSKPLTRTQKLRAELRVCRKKRSRAKRTGCERQARRRYGASAARRVAAPSGKRG